MKVDITDVCAQIVITILDRFIDKNKFLNQTSLNRYGN